ncbi:MAG: hypothetical protein IKG09_01100 [Mycoplasmataceae bacterium]|nr:hypothetical protein [Mycoplasmataceae bacterium]MBR3259342.1 hypothetical protein [Mycoplasmataceae bacterium]MBR4025324.1 hypothetical protein [Mycoplasmataceae bacterium]
MSKFNLNDEIYFDLNNEISIDDLVYAIDNSYKYHFYEINENNSSTNNEKNILIKIRKIKK